MILRAIGEFEIDPARSILVGDQGADLLAARAAGVRGVLDRGGDLAEILAREFAALGA
jgi:D-glycero-D-manno-heptose 1,7-bisphosphate phosphatase